MAVLTVYQRPQLLQKQLTSLHDAKTVVMVNGCTDLPEDIASCQLLYSSTNLGVWARFYPLLETTEPYLCVLDDDTIPEAGWLINAVKLLDDHPSVGVACAGGTIFPNGAREVREYVVGPQQSPVPVDLPGYGYVFRRELLAETIALRPRFYATAGENYALAVVAQRHGLGCWVVPGPAGCPNPSMGDDDVALYKRSGEEWKKARSHQTARWLGWCPQAVQDKTTAVPAEVPH